MEREMEWDMGGKSMFGAHDHMLEIRTHGIWPGTKTAGQSNQVQHILL